MFTMFLKEKHVLLMFLTWLVFYFFFSAFGDRIAVHHDLLVVLTMFVKLWLKISSFAVLLKLESGMFFLVIFILVIFQPTDRLIAVSQGLDTKQVFHFTRLTFMITCVNINELTGFWPSPILLCFVRLACVSFPFCTFTCQGNSTYLT